jgi:dienelactone hydrolase
LQSSSAGWSRNLKVPYILLARPGVYGSSGVHAERRARREIDLVSAALDAIKAAHGYRRLHLVGYATGGHTAAALLAQRNDIGCAVLASAFVAVRSWLAETGRSADVTGNKHPVDPIALTGKIAKRPDLRIFVVTDPDDTVISARSQTQYFRSLVAAGLPARQIFVAAPDAYAHELWRDGRMIAASCSRGTADDTIVSIYQNKVPATPPDADDPPLHRAELLRTGARLAEGDCKALPKAAWVRVQGRGFCVRYWMSTAGGTKDEALVFIHGDILPGQIGKAGLNRYAAVVTAGRMQRDAHAWSRIHGAPYLAIGRVGAYGSSGDHRDRKRPIEIKVMMAALDALKAEQKLARFHLVGQSGGAHTVAALIQMRADIGCAVIASGGVSHKSAIRDRGLAVTARIRENYDPIDHVGAMQNRPGQRIVVMSDPDDRFVSFRSQREFVERVRGAGLPILHISAAAGDEDFHGLESEGRKLASDCSKGVDDATLISRYQTKSVTAARRR